MSFDVTILGSSSATPIYQRHPTAQVITVQERFFLMDCGEGTLIQLNRYRIKFHRINHIYISHLHGDHYLGLLGLVSTMHLQGRTTDLHIYGPPELREIVEIQLKYSETKLRYGLVWHYTDPRNPGIVYEDDHMTVESFPLSHRIPCTGFLFREKQRRRKLIRERLAEYQVPVADYTSLKEGKDYITPDGKVVPNGELTLDPPRARSYAFCSDTIYDPRLTDVVRGVDLLYHEATFLTDMEERARETFHSTAAQAAMIARDAAARRLIIGHFSARYKNLYPLLEEARAVFASTTLAMEGDRFAID
jgi:ribonuclease Z